MNITEVSDIWMSRWKITLMDFTRQQSPQSTSFMHSSLQHSIAGSPQLPPSDQRVNPFHPMGNVEDSITKWFEQLVGFDLFLCWILNWLNFVCRMRSLWCFFRQNLKIIPKLSRNWWISTYDRPQRALWTPSNPGQLIDVIRERSVSRWSVLLCKKWFGEKFI